MGCLWSLQPPQLLSLGSRSAGSMGTEKHSKKAGGLRNGDLYSGRHPFLFAFYLWLRQTA